MLQQAPTNNAQPAHRINKGLALSRVRFERPNREFRARDGEVERLTGGCGEGKVDHGRE
jgi:hypothetical protein